MPIQNHSGANTPQSAHITHNNTLNNNTNTNGAVNPTANNNSTGNYSHLKYTEQNYKEFQKTKTEATNSTPATPTVTLPVCNVFEKNPAAKQANSTNPTSVFKDGSHANENDPVISNRENNNGINVQTATLKNSNVNFTKIPLSPKSKS